MTTEGTTANDESNGTIASDVANIQLQVGDSGGEVSVTYSVTPKSDKAHVGYVGISLVKLKNGLIKENYGGNRTLAASPGPGSGMNGNFGVDNPVFSGETDYLAVVLDASIVTPGPEPTKDDEPRTDETHYIHEVRELEID